MRADEKKREKGRHLAREVQGFQQRIEGPLRRDYLIDKMLSPLLRIDTHSHEFQTVEEKLGSDSLVCFVVQSILSIVYVFERSETHDGRCLIGRAS